VVLHGGKVGELLPAELTGHGSRILRLEGAHTRKITVEREMRTIPHFWVGLLMNDSAPVQGVFPGHAPLATLVGTYAGHLNISALYFKVRS
jgi:hypothetical protein